MSEKKYECINAKELKHVLSKVPDDAKIYYERIEDAYFEKHGWESIPLADDAWWMRIGLTQEEHEPPSEWLESLQVFYNKKENAVKLTSHF